VLVPRLALEPTLIVAPLLALVEAAGDPRESAIDAAARDRAHSGRRRVGECIVDPSFEPAGRRFVIILRGDATVANGSVDLRAQ
jgi:hypothetical protein